jgi:putative FmdB family regulatory protein
MPIYEYECRACHHRFEQLVLASTTPECPACGGQSLERLVSLFAVDSEMTGSSALKTARQQSDRMRRDKIHAEHEYIHKHQH